MARIPLFKRLRMKPRRPARTASPADLEGFWDRPQLLTLVADLLLLFGGVALAYAATLAVARLPLFPLRQLVVISDLQRVQPAQLKLAAQSAVVGNFFTVNLDAVRAEFEKQPWVRRVSVRRLWPDGIELSLEEQHATAHWGLPSEHAEARWVNTRGEVFAAPPPVDAAAGGAKVRTVLPVFSGPEGSAALMLSRYGEFTTLLAPVRRTPSVVALSARLAWQLKLDDGLTLELGRDNAKNPLEERLTRFVAVYGPIKARFHKPIGVIDMRYQNGFALRPASREKGAT
jgi:cell division protein FtsQ